MFRQPQSRRSGCGDQGSVNHHRWLGLARSLRVPVDATVLHDKSGQHIKQRKFHVRVASSTKALGDSEKQKYLAQPCRVRSRGAGRLCGRRGLASARSRETDRGRVRHRRRWGQRISAFLNRAHPARTYCTPHRIGAGCWGLLVGRRVARPCLWQPAPPKRDGLLAGAVAQAAETGRSSMLVPSVTFT